jgi:hypothetical protein
VTQQPILFIDIGGLNMREWKHQNGVVKKKHTQLDVVCAKFLSTKKTKSTETRAFYPYTKQRR